MKAEAFDKCFDGGESVAEQLDWSKATRPHIQLRQVNVAFPAWVVQALDREADRLGITRQDLVKMWIAERLKDESAPHG